MSLMTVLNEDMKLAMKAKDKERLQVIRMLKSSVQKEEIALKRELNDEEALTLLARELKQRKDALAEFTSANREDLIQKTQFEIDVVTHYMPKQLSEDEIKASILAIISQMDAADQTNFGKIMGVAMAQLKGQADGAVVRQLVQSVMGK